MLMPPPAIGSFNFKIFSLCILSYDEMSMSINLAIFLFWNLVFVCFGISPPTLNQTRHDDKSIAKHSARRNFRGMAGVYIMQFSHRQLLLEFHALTTDGEPALKYKSALADNRRLHLKKVRLSSEYVLVSSN